MKEWQFNVLFFVAVIGAVIILIGPSIGLAKTNNPVAISGVGTILTFVLTQKAVLTKNKDDDKKDKEE